MKIIMFYETRNTIKLKKYLTVGTIRNSNIKVVEICKIDTPDTQILDRSLSWLSTGTSIKINGGVKLVWWAQTFPLSEMVRSCKCFPRMNKMPTLTYNWTKNIL